MKKRYMTLDSLPNSSVEPLLVTSLATGNYNCIAWVLEDTTNFYWPVPEVYFYWEQDLPREETIDCFIQLFARYGYEICENALKERGFTKIALFTKEGIPTHATRQLPNGLWTSKLGILEDVRHTLSAISGGLYGSVAVVLKKKNVKLLKTAT